MSSDPSSVSVSSDPSSVSVSSDTSSVSVSSDPSSVSVSSDTSSVFWSLEVCDMRLGSTCAFISELWLSSTERLSFKDSLLFFCSASIPFATTINAFSNRPRASLSDKLWLAKNSQVRKNTSLLSKTVGVRPTISDSPEEDLPVSSPKTMFSAALSLNVASGGGARQLISNTFDVGFTCNMLSLALMVATFIWSALTISRGRRESAQPDIEVMTLPVSNTLKILNENSFPIRFIL